MPSINKKISNWVREVPLSKHLDLSSLIFRRLNINALLVGLTRQPPKQVEVHFYG